jgi:glutathione S-transferase
MKVGAILVPPVCVRQPMITVFHYPFCPQSRFVRLVMAEMGVDPEWVEERPWERRLPFLEMNPAGTVPVLVDEESVVPGACVIAEYLDETRGAALGDRRLMPQDLAARTEVRRLLDWFQHKIHDEVTGYLVTEKIQKRFMAAQNGGGSPDMGGLRAARANIRYHLKYIGYLIATRNWLAGDQLTYVDLAAAAHLSIADYLGDVPWDEDETARRWYARVKSRPSFRALLADRVMGMPASVHYANLDF